MNLNILLKEKREKNLFLKNKFGLIKKNKAVGLIKLQNKSFIKDLRDGLLVLPSSFIVYVEGIENEKLGNNLVATGNIDDNDLIGFDFIVCDDDISNLNSYLDKGIAPIINNDNHLINLLKEFNPLKNEGNSYIYEGSDKWSIYYAIIRYMENFKFPFDNKNLVKNVINL